MDGGPDESPATTPQRLQRGRFSHHKLRRASFISPATGERSKRVFTLREASNRLDGHLSESEPLLGHERHNDRDEPSANAFVYIRERWDIFYAFADSTTGRGIFKCSLAYLLGSLVTFVPALAGMIGRQQDSKHMVATVCVWFHPSRTLGSMHEATILGFLGLLYSGFLGLGSMGMSLAFREQGLQTLGHAFVLILFVGAGLGSIGWTKQHFGSPLVNVACSLASLGCVTTMIKEGSVQAGEFSLSRVGQVLLMVALGVIIATAVNIFVLPVTARRQLRNEFEKNTDLLAEILICITRAFLSGREQDLGDEYFTSLSKDSQQSLQRMAKSLSEARAENYLIGKEKGYEVSTKVVDCLEGLAQDLGGLRSAALAQFALISSDHHVHGEVMTPPTAPQDIKNQISAPDVLDAITEVPDEVLESDTLPNSLVNHPLSRSVTRTESSSNVIERQASRGSMKTVESPNDMFYTFIRQLGPPTKSLVFTLKGILDELPYKKRTTRSSGLSGWMMPEVEVAVNDVFHASLRDALDLYRSSRKEALDTLYASRALTAAFAPKSERRPGAFSGKRNTYDKSNLPDWYASLNRPSEEVLADIEEVSACCGHFSASLLDFAENVLEYLSVLDELRDVMENPRFSWTWLMVWRRTWRGQRRKKFHSGQDLDGDEHGHAHNFPDPIQKADYFAEPGRLAQNRPWYYKLYRMLSPFRRDDVKFAIKVGIGAVLYSLPAFIETTRPYFVQWRGEWGLVSYMAVISISFGAGFTTLNNRFLGTMIGGLLAIIAWILASDDGDANPYLLAIFGWIIATGCFYLILAKDQGPLGRFILLTYNLGALYSYSLSVHDGDHDDDEGGISPEIFTIVGHRLVAVMIGALWALVIMSAVWPLSARRKLKDGLCVLWLRMALVWKRDPLALFLTGAPRSSYMDIREEAELHSFLGYLDSLQAAAKSEFELRGPFPEQQMSKIVERTRRMLDAFHAINIVITKNMQSTAGERAILQYTSDQRAKLSARISHLFSVLTSSLKLEYPIVDNLPSIENSRDSLLSRMSEFRRSDQADAATEADYELLYAYVLVTGQLAQDIEAVSAEIGRMFGTLDEENLKLQ